MKGKRWVLTAAMLVAGIRLWMQVRGKAKTPFGEWAVGWGATFFFIALISEAYPQAASALAGTIVVGDFLVNGAELFGDMTRVVTGAETAPLADHPFAATAAATAAGAPAGRTAGQTGPAPLTGNRTRTVTAPGSTTGNQTTTVTAP